MYVDKEYIEQKHLKNEMFFLNLQEKEFDGLFQRYYRQNIKEIERMIQGHGQRLDQKKRQCTQKYKGG